MLVLDARYPPGSTRSTSATCGTWLVVGSVERRAAHRRRGARVRRRARTRPARPPSGDGDPPHVHHVRRPGRRARARARCTATAARSTTSCPSSRASTSRTTTSATRCSPSSTRWGARRARPRRSGSGTASSCARGSPASGFWDDVRACGATWAGYFGAVVLFLWQQEPRRRRPRHGLRRAFGSSAAPELIVPWEERFGVTLFEVYGSTEIGLGSGLGTGPRKLGTMGLPCRHLEVQIVDERDEPVPAGVVGEALGGEYPYAIFQGYWNRRRATLETFRNLWSASGDAGYLDDEGYFVFKDRLKDSIRRRREHLLVRGRAGGARAGRGRRGGGLRRAGDRLTEEEVMVAVVPVADGPPDPETLFRALCQTMPRATPCRGTCGSWTSSRRRPRSGSRSSGSARTASPRTPSTARRSASTRRASEHSGGDPALPSRSTSPGSGCRIGS